MSHVNIAYLGGLNITYRGDASGGGMSSSGSGFGSFKDKNIIQYISHNKCYPFYYKEHSSLQPYNNQLVKRHSTTYELQFE